MSRNGTLEIEKVIVHIYDLGDNPFVSSIGFCDIDGKSVYKQANELLVKELNDAHIVDEKQVKDFIVNHKTWNFLFGNNKDIPFKIIRESELKK